jgi:redox-sensitive bicupin YhaK (pirin superfamily)
MITLRRAQDRGHANHGWLDTHHTFSFANYHDDRHMGFRSLRVINDDTVAPGEGFGTHGHRDMEIISYVLEGALSHQDSMGTKATLRPGDIQVMSAGTGVRHSEFNGDPNEKVHFLQMWIEPDQRGSAPRYADRTIPAAEKLNRLRLLASADGRDGSLPIHQDASVYATVVEPGNQVGLALAPGRAAWVHVARGSLTVNGNELKAGDGLALTGEKAVELKAVSGQGEAIVFDLA